MYNSKLQLRVQLISSLYYQIKDMDKTIEECRKAERYVLEGINIKDTSTSYEDLWNMVTTFATKDYTKKDTIEDK